MIYQFLLQVALTRYICKDEAAAAKLVDLLKAHWAVYFVNNPGVRRVFIMPGGNGLYPDPKYADKIPKTVRMLEFWGKKGYPGPRQNNMPVGAADLLEKNGKEFFDYASVEFMGPKFFGKNMAETTDPTTGKAASEAGAPPQAAEGEKPKE